jgi:hypothetical protein
MADDITYDPNTHTLDRRKTTTGNSVDTDLAVASASSTASTGLGAKGTAGKTPMPKQSDFPGDTKGWSDAVRKWRTAQSEDPENIAQKKVLSNMSGSADQGTGSGR